MASFIDFEIETDEESLIELYHEQMEAEFPGWTSPPASYEDFMARVWARMAVETAELAADVPAEIFYQFGEKIIGIPPDLATPAIAETTWTMRDDQGYTIYEDTLVSIAMTGNDLIGFRVREDVSVPIGETVATAVTLEAAEPGAFANGAAGPVELLDALTFVESIELDAPAAGGTDAEDPEDYLDRLREELQLLAPRPILPGDVEIMARRIPGVHRSLALDLYDPDTETWDNEKTVTVAVVGEDGEPVTGPTKDAVAALLALHREVNFVFHVIDPTYTTIDVDATITTASGFDPATVEANVAARLAQYLDPALWGVAASEVEGDQGFGWSRSDSVYINELIALIDNVTGVDRVVSVEAAKQGDALGTATVALDGPAALTRAGTIEVGS